MAFFAVVFWEYFIDHDRNKRKISPYIRYLVIFLLLQLVVFFVLYFSDHPFLVQPYYYVKFGLVMIASMVIVTVIKFPWQIRKLLLFGTYFIFVSILNEYVALRQSHWLFPGNHYLGFLPFVGYEIPIDEIIFWWILGAPGLVCWYEIFADDRK